MIETVQQETGINTRRKEKGERQQEILIYFLQYPTTQINQKSTTNFNNTINKLD